jgi:CS domain
MPITGSYSWSEKNDLIKIIIPLKGTPIKTVDIFVTSNTLKVNFSPYIVDIVLSSSVDALKHKATVKDGNLQITLYKTTNSTGLWGTLEINSDDKALLSKLREDSLLKQDVLEKDLGDKRRDRRIDDERYSLRKQMGLDEAERNRLDVLKLDEKQAAEEEVYATFARMNYTTDTNKSLKTTQDLAISALSTPQVKEAIDFDTYLRDKELRTSASKSSSAAVVKESKDIFEDSCIEIIDTDGGQFDDDDTDYTEAMSIVECSTGIVHHPSSSSESNSLIEREVDDVRFIPPPRALSSTGEFHDGNLKCKIIVFCDLQHLSMRTILIHRES